MSTTSTRTIDARIAKGFVLVQIPVLLCVGLSLLYMVTVICGYDSRIRESMSPTSSLALVIITSGYVSGAFWALFWTAWTEGMAFCTWGATVYWLAAGACVFASILNADGLQDLLLEQGYGLPAQFAGVFGCLISPTLFGVAFYWSIPIELVGLSNRKDSGFPSLEVSLSEKTTLLPSFGPEVLPSYMSTSL